MKRSRSVKVSLHSQPNGLKTKIPFFELIKDATLGEKIRCVHCQRDVSFKEIDESLRGFRSAQKEYYPGKITCKQSRRSNLAWQRVVNVEAIVHCVVVELLYVFVCG